MKRILIDGRFIGIGESMTRYCLEILKGILSQDKENEYTLLIRPAGEKVIKNSKLKNHLPAIASPACNDVATSGRLKAMQAGNVNLKIKILDIKHYSLGEQTKLLKYLNKEKFDLVHFIQFNHPIKYRGKFVVTVHDLTLLGHLHRMGRLQTFGFRAVMKSAVKNSSKIITDSKFSKNDIVDIYRTDPSKIEVIYLGVDSKYNSRIKNDELRIKKFKEKYQIAGDYILYTGLWKRHKNILRLLKAYEKYYISHSEPIWHAQGRLREESVLQLVLVGKEDPKEPEVKQLIDDINERIRNYELGIKNENRNSNFVIRNSIVSTGFVEEEELPIAYAGALAYCIPSLSEGFGLPPLEAMACGTPVISSNASCMPEILGDAVLYFDPLSIEDIAKAIEKVSSDEKLREELSKKGIERAKKYNWADTAKQTFEVYKRIFNI